MSVGCIFSYLPDDIVMLLKKIFFKKFLAASVSSSFLVSFLWSQSFSLEIMLPYLVLSPFAYSH